MSSSDDHATLDAALTFVDEYVLADFEPVLTPSDHAGDTIPLLPLDALGDDDIVLYELSPIDQEHDGAFGTDTTTTMEVEPSPSAKESGSTKSAKRTSTNRSRARQKDELVYLRGVVADLEAQMVVLKRRSDARVGTKTKEPLAFAWEELAARQYAQRRRAEVKNAKLKTVLEEQIRVAKNLERVLKKRTMTKHLVSSAAKRTRTYQASRADGDLHVFDELLLAIDDMYTQVNAVFADKRFTRTVPALNEIQARNDDALGTIVEVFDSRLGPFDMDKISDVTWHHIVSKAIDPNAFDDEVVEVTDTMLKRKFSSSIDLPRFKGTYHVKIAARRIVEDERVLMLWAGLVDPEKISDKPMDGLLLRQRGWTVFRRPPPSLVKADRSATISQLYYTIVPEIDDDELSDQRRKVGTLTNFVLGSVNFHLEMARQMIENLLLQDLQKAPASTASRPEPARSLSDSQAGNSTEHEPAPGRV